MSQGSIISNPLTCYCLDALLLIYCLIFTTLYFREKFSRTSVSFEADDETKGVYQELQPHTTNDIYEKLETSGKKKGGKRKRKQKHTEEDQYDSLSAAAPPSAPSAAPADT